ncbi:MAG: MFS transporter, partial [Janthinobacterium lividum]
MYPSLAATFRLGSSELGVAVALGRLASLPLGPLWVALSSRLGRRAVLVASVALAGVVIGVGGSVRTFLGILVVQILLSASAAGVLPIAQTVIADSFDDRHRSRAVGCFFGVSTLLAASLGPLFALWVRLPEGWRWSMRTAGVACVMCAVLIAVLYREPRTGGAEGQSGDAPLPRSGRTGSNRVSVAALLRMPTFIALMVSRLLSGHALIVVFGVQFLVLERGFANVGAAVVVLPYGVGYFLGALAGGWLVTLVHARYPQHGRIAVLQAAQLGFAAVAYVATQVVHDTLFVYASCCLVLGALQAVNPVVNRPLVMAVVVPEIRGQA